MKFRETTQEDLDFVANHSVSRGVQGKHPGQIEYYFTLEHEDKPLAIGGFHLINNTTAWAWVDLTDLAGSHITAVYRAIKEWTELFVEAHRIKRLQAYVECDFPEAIRMAQHLGYKEESTMERFVDDRPAYMYVRII